MKPGKFRFDYGAPSKKNMRLLALCAFKEPDQANEDCHRA